MKTPALLLLATLALGAHAAEPIKLGEYASLTGKEAGFGQTSHQGIVLAIEEINAGGGVARPPPRARSPRTTRPNPANPPPS
jgi:branched-chain amino acid transport system substrate-binding protein